jgi:hypothetical protein
MTSAAHNYIEEVSSFSLVPEFSHCTSHCYVLQLDKFPLDTSVLVESYSFNRLKRCDTCVLVSSCLAESLKQVP